MRASADARESRYVSSALVDRCRIAIELLSKALVFLYGLTGERARPAGGLGLLINARGG